MPILRKSPCSGPKSGCITRRSTPKIAPNVKPKEGKIDHIDRVITFEGELSTEQRQRLLEIADKCPVHRTLKSEVDIRTAEAPIGV